MDERDWYLLSLIGEYKSLSKVSEELSISQPALSYRLNKIEAYFDSKLFIRTNRGLQITPQGKIITDYAKQYIQSLNSIKEELYTMENDVKGTLNIGASGAVAQYLLPSLLAKFHALYPDVDLNLETGFSPTLIEGLMQNRVHVTFLREELDISSYKKLLATDGIYLVSNEPVNIADLPHLNRVEYKTNVSLKLQLDSWWTQNFKVSPTVAMVVDNAEACKEMVRHGLGYAILTGLTLNNQEDLHLVHLKSNGKKMNRHTWVYATEEAMDYITVRTFLDFIETEMQQYDGY